RLLFSKNGLCAEQTTAKHEQSRPKESHLIFCAPWFENGVQLRSSLAIASLPRTKAAVFEPIRYLNRVRTRISASEFEHKVDSFMEGILSRLQSRNVDDKNLAALWTEVLGERNNPKASERRILEAILGFDPDEAPDELLKQVLNDVDQLGRNAVVEVAAEARDSAPKVLELIRELLKAKGKPKGGGFRVSLPDLNIPPGFDERLERPWQKGSELAKIARKQWGFDGEPVENAKLANLIDTKSTLFTNSLTSGTRIPFGVRKGSTGLFDVFFDSPNETSRRFAICRMIGDHLFFASQEMLLPTTRAKTARQQFQRAFAQEFLCPFEALRQRLPSQPDEDDISNVAKSFDVSPLLVRTTLVNKGELDREALNWND
ncbi:MAG: hypothetical protein AB1813_28670, partial [Verrucomicrobiota bacterium]